MKLTIENSWWNEGGLWQDPDLMKVKKSCLSYRQKPFDSKLVQEKAVLTLRGPRRVGKTVALKLLVAKLIEEENWNGRDILWTTFDTLRTLSQMEEHLISIMKMFNPKLLLIDEVTAVSGWQRVIKKLRDTGVLTHICIILTGSSAYDLKVGAERMAGRRGQVQNPDRVLLPLSFGDFCEQLKKNNISYNLDESIQLYLRVGGFPFRVESFIESKLSKGVEWDDLNGFQIFDEVFFYEFIRRRLDRSIALEVLGRLASVQCSALSYEAFVKPLAIAKDTARKYLDALGDAFLLATVSSFDTSRGRVAPKKDRKFCWSDPAFGFMGQWLKQGEKASEASRAEWAVGAELLRKHEVRVWEGLSAPRNVFTWKSSSGNEIDYLIVDKSKKIRYPIEVKYQKNISDWDFQVIERAFHKGLLVTPCIDRKRKKSQAISLAHFLTLKQSDFDF